MEIGDISSSLSLKLEKSIEQNDKKKFIQIIEDKELQGLSLSDLDIWNEPLIMVASHAGSYNIVETLIDRGVDVNFKHPSEDCTPLYYVTTTPNFKSNHLTTLLYLVSKGANIRDISDKYGNTALSNLKMQMTNYNAEKESVIEAIATILRKCPKEEDIVSSDCHTLNELKYVFEDLSHTCHYDMKYEL